MSVDGTPVDCVRAAFGIFENKFDGVLSGVNAGANLGVDLLVSGTFAAAREAAMCGVPAMAVSHYRHPDIPRTWTHVPTWMAETIKEFCEQFQQVNQPSVGAPNALLWNVNLPAIHPEAGTPPLVRCEVDTEPMTRRAVLEGKQMRFDADFHARPRRQGRDVDRCFSGSMTISELSQPFRP
jgi:5'-nucleotidase